MDDMVGAIPSLESQGMNETGKEVPTTPTYNVEDVSFLLSVIPVLQEVREKRIGTIQDEKMSFDLKDISVVHSIEWIDELLSEPILRCRIVVDLFDAEDIGRIAQPS